MAASMGTIGNCAFQRRERETNAKHSASAPQQARLQCMQKATRYRLRVQPRNSDIQCHPTRLILQRLPRIEVPWTSLCHPLTTHTEPPQTAVASSR